uniref:Uncharacterized protein LOC111128566 n=1 Tax=Crassostrea virginica TaxID=6565 RepID=A0A8B8DQK2_CRAVI|nr:uncharacterized protein LOC111128566 [Crassostrea virginica]
MEIETDILLDNWIFKEESQINLLSLRQNGCVHGTYVTTVFLLDTSDSMCGEGLEQMKSAFKDIVNEFSLHPNISENVMVITFGRDVKVLQYYSTDYKEIVKCVDNLTCEGGSPLRRGIELCLCGIEPAPFTSIGSFDVRTRIVIITDGKPTDSGDDVDIDESLGLNETGEAVFDIVNKIGKHNPIFCIPVGKTPNICFLGASLVGSPGGKIIPFKDARQFGRYALNIDLASKVLQRTPVFNKVSKETIKKEVWRIKSVSEKDLDDVCELIEKKDVYKSSYLIAKELFEKQEEEYRERDANMPNIGTRVRRGPDWKWQNQDGGGSGTVTGHSRRIGWLNVQWDTGLALNYRYGTNGFITAYDIEPCDEPRILLNEPIAVGCLVRRGLDWKWGNQDGGAGNIGKVYRLKTPTEVYVRWPDGNKSNYRYGYQNYYDVELCDPFDKTVQEALQAEREATKKKHELILDKRRDTFPLFAVDGTSSKRGGSSFVRKVGTHPDIIPSEHRQERMYFKNPTAMLSEKVWQWRAFDNTWKTFPKDVIDTIENCSEDKENIVIINLNGQTCKLNLQRKVMVNTVTKEETDIRLCRISQ